MAGHRIGDVFVGINADTSLFRTQAYTGVKKSLAGIEANIPIRADTKVVRGQIDALKARMEALNKTLNEIKIGADGKPAEATIRKLQLDLASLADLTAHVTLGADTTKLDAAIAREELKLAKLNEEASTLHMDADDKALVAKLARLDLQAISIDKRLSHLEVGVDDREIQDLFDLLEHIDAETARLKGRAAKIVLDADATRLLRAIAESEAAIKAMKAEAEHLKLGGTADLATLAGIEGRLLGVEEAAKKLNPEVKVLNDKLVQGARGFGRFGLGLLTARVALFGGLSAISGFHIALDAIIEGLAVIVPALATAAAGLAAFALAGSDAFRQVYQRLQNIHVVSDAFGVTIGPMTGKLEKLHQVVRPQVWQLYGDAIAIAHSKTGLFGKLATETGGLIDRLAGRLTVLATTAGPGLTKFLDVGKKDLQQFGRIFTNLGDAFGKLIQITEKTHIAEFLLKIVNAGAKLIDIFTKMPIPLLAAIVAIHGIYLWSGLAATGIIALLRPLTRLAAAAAGTKATATAMEELALAGGGSKFARLGATFKDLGTNLKALPGRVGTLASAFKNLVAKNWQAVVAGVVIAGLVTIGIWLSRTKSRAQELLGQIDQLGRAANIFNVFNNLGARLIVTNRGLASAQKDLNSRLQEGSQLAPAMAARFGPLGSGAQEAADRTAALTARHKELQGTLLTVTTRLGGVAKAYGTDGLAGAMALANLAGVKVDQLLSSDKSVWAGALAQIDGVVQGYQNMGQGSTQLANDINVLTIAQSDQLKNMQTLNSAFDTFTQIVSGPIDTFLKLANTLKRFGTDAQAAGANMSGLGTGFTSTSKKVTDASLQLQSDFQDTFKSATDMADAMRLTGTASDKQVAAIKNVVQVLIPMAGSNKAAAAEISALAQEAGGPATTSLKDLAKWAGHTKDPLGAAQKAADNAAIGFSNMSLDAQKLGTTLSQDLTKDMAAAVENAVGLQGALNTFAKDLQHGTDVTAKGHKDRAQLYKDLAIVGVTGKQADAIVKALSDRLSAHGKALEATAKARALFNTDMQKILDKAPNARTDINKLVDITALYGTTADRTKGARQQLYMDLRQAGVDAKTAHRLVADMQTAINNLHGKGLKISMQADGSVNVTGKGGGTWNISQGAWFSPHAEGGFISGGTPNRDSVPAMLMPGEVVVPTNMVKRGAVDHLRGYLPGFASGGAVGASKLTGAPNTWPGQMYDKFQSFGQHETTKALTSALAAAVKAAIKAAQAALLSGGGTGSAILAFAETFKNKVPYVWGGSTPAGWDCSGFVSYVYDHFKLFKGRTTAAGLQQWARASAPTPGGMAFYGSPAHHVGFVVNGHTLLSALGRKWGTIESSLNMGDNSGYGVPPHGFGKAGGPAGAGGSLPKGKLQELAFSLLNQYGWGNQWGSFNALETREAGWRMNAVNPSSGAAGLAQFIHGFSEYYQYGGNPNTGLGQLTAMFNYIASRYGSPNAAWAHETRFGWYGSGGMVPGYAAGGSVAAIHDRLAREQASERSQYAGLLHAFMTGPKKYRTKTVMSELGTLGRRQKDELSAYSATLGSRLSNPTLHHLGAEARAVSRVALDQALNEAPGGHPAIAKNLRAVLAQISATASGNVPAGSSGGTGGGPPPLTKAFRAKLTRAESMVEHAYATAASFIHHKGLKLSTRNELGTLARRESAEVAAWRATFQHFTRGNVDHLGAAARAELRTARDKGLAGVPGIGNLIYRLRLLDSYTRGASTVGISPGGSGGGGTGGGGTGGGGKGLPPGLPPVRHVYGGDVSGLLGAFISSVASPFGAAAGGMVFDRGGWLRPGWNATYNATGRNEHLVPVGPDSNHLIIDITGAGTDLEKLLATILKKYVKVRGGNVQKALGAH